ncbi:MAG: hypothetical protein JWO72_3125 [Caulobacteraceae bacterium]|nr:hypothetical protein [Caulobacteraceae bacterium]
MKTYSTAAQAALAAGSVLTVGAVKIATTTPSPFRVWGGHGDLVLDDGAGPETYTGIGKAGLVGVTGSQLGGTEDGIELSLSGVDPSTIAIIDASDARSARVTIWRLLFDVSGQTLLDATVFERGRLDKITMDDMPGGVAAIKCQVETAARGLGRRTGRMASDADQRMIVAGDNSLSRVTQAGDLTLAWGGKPPTSVAAALGPVPIGLDSNFYANAY